jgi:hypothetical protein
VSRSCDHRAARLVERAFVRELSIRKRERLRRHLATCDSCRQRWDRLATIDRQLGGPQLDQAVRDHLLDTVTQPASSRQRRYAGWGLAGALVGAAVLVALWLRPADRDELRPRGAGGSLGRGRTPGVRVFCVAGDADHVRAEIHMTSHGTPPTLRCTLADDLQLAYTTPAHEGLTMVAFARQDASVVHHVPSDGSGDAIRLRSDRVDEPLDWSTRLAAGHEVGGYELVVRVFDGPVATRVGTYANVPHVTELRARLEILAPGAMSHAP